MKVFNAEATSINFDGTGYERGEDGSFDVPAEAARGLIESHGFTAEPKTVEAQIADHAACLATIEDLRAQLIAAEEMLAEHLDAQLASEAKADLIAKAG
jgi:hypothetical protein